MLDLLSVAAGGVVGFFLGLTGGGGSILAVPLMLYVSGITDPHVAIGTGAATVTVSAIANLYAHARNGHVRWHSAAVFALTGVAGVALGSSLGKQTDGNVLLGLFALLMLVIAFVMQRPRRVNADSAHRLSLLAGCRLAGTAVTVGTLSGFFGIGGGFLIVPGLIFATRMATIEAIGSSLLCVTAFSSMTTVNYAASGLVSWHVAGEYALGGVLGSQFGTQLAQMLSRDRHLLNRMFSGVLVVVALYILCRSTFPPVAAHSPKPFNPLNPPPTNTLPLQDAAHKPAALAQGGLDLPAWATHFLARKAQ